MKWFKHYSNASSDEKIAMIKAEFGYEGVGLYWHILEIISNQMKPENCKTCVEYPAVTWRQLTGLSAKKFAKLAQVMSNIGLFYFENSGKTFKVDCPKLLVIKDNHFKNLQVAGKKAIQNLPLDKDKEKDKDPPIIPRGDGEGISGKCWDAFCKHYSLDGISLSQKLSDEVLAHLLEIKHEQMTGSKIRDPVALARKRKEPPARRYQRAVQSWLHPPPSKKECHCGGELESRYAQGSGETSLICLECNRAYPND